VQAAAAFFEALRSRPHALVMGVLNITPDSFSDGGLLYGDPDRAAREGERLLAEGAAILDVGGESTRPGAQAVDLEEELRRVLPVVERLAGAAPLSVDTRHAAVAARALNAGAVLINDVSAGNDPEMFPLVADRGAGLVLMHMQGEPGTMQDDPRYEDVVGEVEAFLLERAAAAKAAGVARERVLVDPGIGFGKTLPHNVELLRALPRLTAHGYPVLIGVSRKRFLGEITGREVSGRGDATTSAVALCAHLGAAVLRVHEVRAALDAARVAARFGTDTEI
jgi:dihydropteroate synthase